MVSSENESLRKMGHFGSWVSSKSITAQMRVSKSFVLKIRHFGNESHRNRSIGKEFTSEMGHLGDTSLRKGSSKGPRKRIPGGRLPSITF